MGAVPQSCFYGLLCGWTRQEYFNARWNRRRKTRTVRSPQIRCRDAKDSFYLKSGIEEARERMEAQAGASKEKAGDFLARFPRPCRRVAHFRVVLAQFGLPVS